MATGGPIEAFCAKLTCPVCLDFFRDPVTIPECGRSFCRACLTRSWAESGTSEPSCPQCRRRAQPKSLRPNQQLADFVEIAKRFRPLEGKEGEGREAICERHQEPLELYCRADKTLVCLVCERCKEHRHHEVILLEEACPEIKCQTVIKAEERRVCEKHQEPLKLFCKDDDVPICVACIRSEEHSYHTVIPFAEAAQEYKDQICSWLESLKKEEGNFVTYKAQAIRESLDLLKTTKAEKEKIVAEFQQLHQFLEQQEKLHLAWIEELEKEIARRKEEYLAKLSEELSSLQGHIREMEEKYQQPDSELLQETRSNLRSYQKKFEYPEAFPAELKWRIWEFRDLHPFLESVMKQFKGTLISGPQKPKAANVTLDLDTAHPKLILSEDRKSVRLGKKDQALPDNPKRFNSFTIVLGHEGFTSGQHFWEVTVGSEGGWSVGVAKKSVGRKGYITVCPSYGIWAVENYTSGCRALHPYMDAEIYFDSTPVSLKVVPRRIKVCLNYDKGRVAFFDADTAAPIYTFSEASFDSETIFPFFWVRSKAQLDLSF